MLAHHFKSNRLLFAMGALMILANVIIYAQTRHFGFVLLDDPQLIYENPHLQSLSGDNLKWMLTEGAIGNWIPLTYFVFAVLHSFFGFDAGVFHVANVLFHIINAFLVWTLLFRFLMSVKTIHFGKNNTHQERFLLCMATWAGAFLWSINPLRVESVAWITEMKDTLFLMFYLLSLMAYLEWLKIKQKQITTVFYQSAWWWLCLVFYICSGLSKAMAVSLPLVLFMIDFALQRKWSLEMIREKVPHVFFTFFVMLMSMTVAYDMKVSTETVPLFVRLITALNGLGFYIEKTFLPFDLAPIYYYEGIKPEMFPFMILSAWIISSILVAAMAFGNRWVRVSLMFYVITLFPVLGIVQVGSQEAADRFSYLPSLILFLWIAVFILHLFTVYLKNTSRHRIVAGLMMGIFVFISVASMILSYRQTTIWKNSWSLWGHQLSTRLNQHLLNVYGDFFLSNEKPEIALYYFTLGNKMYPMDADFLYKAALSTFKMGDRQKTLLFSRAATRLDPGFIDAYKLEYYAQDNEKRKEEILYKIHAADKNIK